MTALPVAWAVGGTILTDKAWKELSPEHQALLTETTAKLSKELLQLTREDNRKAYEAMRKLGIQVTRMPTPAEMEEFVNVAKTARKNLVGKLYSQELLDQVEGLVAEYRSQHPTPAQ
jgi:TRAP-type C4-dicarboxylate transport system substrate-binding protein